MKSLLTVVTPAPSQDLTLLATVKAELGITVTTEDPAIETWIDQASAACAAYCNRVFGSETVTETFRNLTSIRDRLRREKPDVLLLERFPVTAFTSIVEDGTALIEDTDYECDPATGRLYRLLSDGLVNWEFDKLAVTYTGGYALLGALPLTIERACIGMVKLLRANATRDPALRSENILSGLYSYTLFDPGSYGVSGFPADIEADLAPFRNISV
jgi:hypothetical protein